MLSNKNKSILIQTVLIITILFCAAVATNGLAIYYNGSDFYMSGLIDNKRRLTHYVESMMSRYESISWLLDYWLENYELIDTSRTSKDLQKYSSVPSEYLINSKAIMTNEILILTPEQQFLFAEYCYRELMSDFDDIKTMLQPYILYCVKPLEHRRNTAFVFFNAVDKNTDDEFIKEQLGSIWSMNMSKHPVIRKMYETGQESDEFEYVKVKNQEIVYGYMPLKFDGKILCHITAAFRWDDVKNAIYQNIISVEIKNALSLVAAGTILALLLYMLILRPLEKVQSSVREFTRRKDSASIVDELATIKSRNEIGRLADDVSLLAVTLEQYNEEASRLSAEQARIETELSLAAKIQEGVLPKDFPNVKEFSLYAMTLPAREVGGDFYDFFMIDDDHIALVIGDVSGKGMSAALFMMTAKTVLKDCALLSNGASVQNIIREVNNKLCEGNEAYLFVTLWFGIMTISTGEIDYVNAGHQFPALRREGERFKIIDDIHARPLAILPNLIFSSGTLKLNPGDTLFLYTDGVIEANSKEDELFGESGLIDALNLTMGTPQELETVVMNSLNDFHGKRPQFDDITMLCVKYFGA